MRKSVTDILRETDETLFSFEVLPPVKGKSIELIYSTVDRLMAFNPAFIEVTTHRSDFSYRELEPGRYVRIEDRLRPGTVSVSAALKQRYDIPVVPHIICSGYTQQETENELIDLAFFDIFDLLVLRGDKSKMDNRFIPKEGGLTYASQLCTHSSTASTTASCSSGTLTPLSRASVLSHTAWRDTLRSMTRLCLHRATWTR